MEWRWSLKRNTAPTVLLVIPPNIIIIYMLKSNCNVLSSVAEARWESWFWMVGQWGWYLTRCLVSVKPLQSSGFYPWQRSAGNYSNLSIKSIITQSTSALQVTENECTRRQGRLLSDTRAHTPLSFCHVSKPLWAHELATSLSLQTRRTLDDINTGCCTKKNSTAKHWGHSDHVIYV